MSWVFDGAVILIFIVTALIGFHKGFIKYVIAMLGTLVSVIVALVGANYLAEPVYDRFIKQELIRSIQTATADLDVVQMISDELEKEGVNADISQEDIRNILEKGGDIAENVGDYLSENGFSQEKVSDITSKLDDYLHINMTDKLNSYDLSGTSIISQKIKITEDSIDEAISALASDDNYERASYLERKIFAPPIIEVLKVFLFGLCFAVMTLLIKLIILISGVFKKMPVVSAANHFGGLALGLCKGALYVSLIAFLYCMVVNGTENRMEIINSANAENSYLFKYFFDFFYK